MGGGGYKGGGGGGNNSGGGGGGGGGSFSASATGFSSKDGTPGGATMTGPPQTPAASGSVTICYAPPPMLTVQKTGTGTGTVTSDAGRIDCGAACAANFRTERRLS